MRDLDKCKDKVVIQLDNQQVALALLGFIIVTAGVFASGVLVGKRMATVAPPWATADAAAMSAVNRARAGSQTQQLTEVQPGTRAVTAELSHAAVTPPPADPTEAARIATHRQIAAARGHGVARGMIPVQVAGPATPAPQSLPFDLNDRDPARERAALDRPRPSPTAYALQISVFHNARPAQMMAKLLDKKSGSPMRVRKLSDAQGHAFWRLEVGHFDTAKSAEIFQHAFETRTGYPTVLVPIR